MQDARRRRTPRTSSGDSVTVDDTTVAVSDVSIPSYAMRPDPRTPTTTASQVLRGSFSPCNLRHSMIVEKLSDKKIGSCESMKQVFQVEAD